MPIYEYECTSCHHQFDLIQKISEQPVQKCPECLKNSLVKLVSASGFQLKGTGWYETDFKTKKTPATDSSAKKDEAATESKTASDGEKAQKSSSSGEDVA